MCSLLNPSPTRTSLISLISRSLLPGSSPVITRAERACPVGSEAAPTWLAHLLLASVQRFPREPVLAVASAWRAYLQNGAGPVWRPACLMLMLLGSICGRADVVTPVGYRCKRPVNNNALLGGSLVWCFYALYIGASDIRRPKRCVSCTLPLRTYGRSSFYVTEISDRAVRVGMLQTGNCTNLDMSERWPLPARARGTGVYFTVISGCTGGHSN